MIKFSAKRCPVILLGIIRQFLGFIYYSSMEEITNLILRQIGAGQRTKIELILLNECINIVK